MVQLELALGPDLKPGEYLLRCIQPGAKALTKGKEYIGTSSHVPYCFTVTNDAGHKGSFYESRFKLIRTG